MILKKLKLTCRINSMKFLKKQKIFKKIMLRKMKIILLKMINKIKKNDQIKKFYFIFLEKLKFF